MIGAGTSASGQGDEMQLDELIGSIAGEAQAAWPELSPLGEHFARFLAGKVATGDSSPTAALLELCHTDLYLACACARGESGAIAAFMRIYETEIDAVLRHLGASMLFHEIKAMILDALFIAETGTQPKIASYSGRGRLRSWLRSVTVRSTLKTMARYRPGEPLADDDAVATAADEPAFKEQYTAAFNEALRTAMESLPRRDRVLLYQHYVDGLGIDQLAAIYQIHRSTAARRIGSARQRVRDCTRALLAGRLDTGSGEFTSMARMLLSRLDVSLSCDLERPGRACKPPRGARA